MSPFSNFVNRLFDNANKSSSSSKNKRQRGRTCRIEELESREMLSVTFAEYEAIREQYADLDLDTFADEAEYLAQTKYNIIEITAEDISYESFYYAYIEARRSDQDDLIVVRTTEEYNKLILEADQQLAINITATDRGSISIVSFGDVPLTIDANHLTRVFDISAVSTVALAGLTITNGVTDENGGGINNSGTLIVVNCTIIGNSAVDGAGIYNTGTLTVIDSTIAENEASGSGGGILCNAALTVLYSTIAGNSAESGGGIYSSGGASQSVTNSVIAGNSADFGGGIYTDKAFGRLTITNSTIAGNSATAGGGIYYANEDGSANDREMVVNNTIIALNFGNDITDNADSEAEIHGTITGHNNILGIRTGQFQFFKDSDGNIVGSSVNPVDPEFLEFEPYSTWSADLWKNWNLRPALGSLAIDKGKNDCAVDAQGNALITDMDGWDRIVDGTVDIGAYERVPVPPAAPPGAVDCTTKTESSITLSWGAVERAYSYTIQYMKSSEASFTLWTGTITEPTATITGLDTDTAYEFQVRAVNPGGMSGWSESVPFTTAAVLPAPENVKATVKNITSLTITWDKVENADGYIVQYIKCDTEEDDFLGALTKTVASGDVTTVDITDLETEATYCIRVIAVGKGDYVNSLPEESDIVRETPRVMPLDVPEDVILDDFTSTTLTFTWEEVENADGYEIEWYSDKDYTERIDFALVDKLTCTITIDDLDPNVTYYVQIRALPAEDDVDHEDSDWVQIAGTTALRLESPVVTTSERTSTTLTFTWEEVGNADGYEIEWYSDDDEESGSETVGADVLTFTIDDLTPTTTYHFKIRALPVKVGGEHEKSIWVETAVTTLTPLVEPTVTLDDSTVSTLTFNWEAVDHADGYEIEWYSDADYTEQVGSKAIDKLTYTIDELDPGESYYVQIRALPDEDDYEASVWTQTNATTARLPLPEPTITPGKHTGTTLTFTWEPVVKAASYGIEWYSTPDFSEAPVGAGTAPQAAQPSYTITGLSADTTYFVRIRALPASSDHAHEESPWTETSGMTTMVSGGVMSNTITIAWGETPLPPGSMFQYKLTSEDNTKWMTWQGGITDNNVKISGLAADTYDVRMLDADGNTVFTETEVVVTASTASVVPPLKPKVSVVKKGVEAPSITSLTLTWTDHKNATAESNARYVVTRFVKVGKTWEVVEQFTASGGKYTFTDLTPNTSYRFTVTAVNAKGDSSNGKAKPKDVAVSVTAKTAKYTAVQRLKVDRTALGTINGVTASSVSLSWIPSKAKTGAENREYVILWMDGKTARSLSELPGTVIADITGTTATVYGLSAYTRYTFVVREIAKNNVGIELGTSLDARVSARTLIAL